nr:MAG TPA: amyloid A4 protein [Caudoviricetes sp.]
MKSTKSTISEILRYCKIEYSNIRILNVLKRLNFRKLFYL